MEELLKFSMPIIIAVFVIVFTIVLFYIISKGINKGNSYKKYGEVSIHIKYKCPKCGQIMENGFVAVDRGITYRSNEKRQSVIFMDPHKRFLKNTFNMSLSAKENLAWRCENCNYVLIDHSNAIGK